MKEKRYSISVLGNKEVTQENNTKFYTTDTDAWIKFHVADLGFSPETATITLINLDDKSVVSEYVEMEDGTVDYHIRSEIIEHGGRWQAQLIFNENKNGYTSGIINFNVHGHIMNDEEPSLEIIENWNVFMRQAEDFLAQYDLRITDLEINKINKNRGAVTMSDLSQEVKEALTGGSVAVVGKDTVLTENIVDRQVTIPKVNLAGVNLPSVFSELEIQSYTSRATTKKPINFKAGDVVEIVDGSELEYFFVDIDTSAWLNSSYTFQEDIASFVRFRKTDNSPFSEIDLQKITNEIYVRDSRTVTNYDSLTRILQEEVYQTAQKGFPAVVVLYDLKIMENTNTPTNRKFTERFNAKSGLRVSMEPDSNYSFAVFVNDSSKTSWIKEYRFNENAENLYLSFKRDDDSLMPSSEREEISEDFNFNPEIDLNDWNVRLPNSTLANTVFYVSPDGDDEADGLSKSNPLETLQKAVESGAETVYMKRGEYQQSFNASAERLIILPLEHERYNYDSPETIQKIVFNGAERLKRLEEFEGVYRQQFEEAPNFRKYFIDQSLPQKDSTSRPQYNCILWESYDLDLDYVMEPVLTIEEVKNTEGTFTWDGEYIYLNPKNIDHDFFVPRLGDGLDLSNIEYLELHDVVADYYRATPINLDTVKYVYAKNSEANHSAYQDGWSINYANGSFVNCKGYKNRNDGFNMHFYGDTEFINCYGINNYDDGISHHEYTTGVIIGGEYSGNGKAGSAPVSNAKVNMYDVWLANNDHGILSSNAAENNLYKGNIIKENRVGITNNVDNTRFVDNKLIDNEIDTSGKVENI